MKTNKNKCILIVLILITSLSTRAQYFKNRYNYDLGRLNYKPEVFYDGLCTNENYANNDPSGYFHVAVGFTRITESPVPVDSFYKELRFVRTNSNGLSNQNKGFAFANIGTTKWFHSEGKSICEIDNNNGNGGYMVAGSVATNDSTGAGVPGKKDALFARITSGGQITKAFRLNFYNGEDEFNCIIASQKDPGYYYACGTSMKSGHAKLIVAKFMASGSVAWANVYHFDGTNPSTFTNFCKGNSIAEDPSDGSIYVAGSYMESSNKDALIVKLFPGSGDVDFVQKHATGNEEEYNCVKVTHDHSIILCGNSAPAGSTGPQLLLTKMTSAGALIYCNLYQVYLSSNAYDLVERKNSFSAYEYHIASMVSQGAGQLNAICKTDESGNFIQAHTYGLLFAYNDKGMGIDTISSGSSPGLCLFSQLHDNTGITYSDAFMMKSYFNGATCTDDCDSIPGTKFPQVPLITVLEDFKQETFTKKALTTKQTNYSNINDCFQNSISCGNNLRIGFETMINQPILSISPNPAYRYISVTILADIPNGKIEISDMQGKSMNVMDLNQFSDPTHVMIDISFLRPGTYLLQVKSGACLASSKFIRL